MLKKKIIINKENIYLLDKYFYTSKKINLEKEIENIINNLFIGTGNYEKLLKPLFISQLNQSWLRSLYIYYFSLKNLKKDFDEVVIEVDFCIFKILKKELGLKILSNGKKIDSRFYLENQLDWLKVSYKESFKNFVKQIFLYFKSYQKIDIIYLNAGKLEKDFNLLKNALNANLIITRGNFFNTEEFTFIKQQIIKNLKNINTSIPKEVLKIFLEEKIVKLVPYSLSYIYTLSDFIKRKKIKLAIISTPSHDKHLSLLIAAKIANIPCLLLGHGLAATKNPFLEKYNFYNGKITNFEYSYNLAKNYKFRPLWLHE